MLDNSEYIIRTFFRGPVCKVQIALNVIRDHFWVMFVDPESDMSIQEPGFLLEQTKNLSLPTEKGSTVAIRKVFSNVYRNHYSKFYHAKDELYRRYQTKIDLNSIWKGEKSDDAPILTVFRHFDSASVHKGVLGGLPRTMWIIDYPLFERIYYVLVAEFDVFGNVTHQTNVRRYMDYLRIEGETNFISFLPADIQVKTVQSWYVGDNSFSEVEFETINIAANIDYITDEPKRELIERIVEEHILKSTGIVFDKVNYYRADNDISYLQFTSLLVETELGSREKRRIQLNRKKAGFPTLKRLDEFDFRFQTTVTKKQIQSLLDFRFIDDRENIVCIGPPGVGKTHLGISIGSKAIDAGYKVWFTSALELVELLEIAETNEVRTLKRLH